MASALTLMAVHAHPDDESSSTGGILARYGSEGITTVLVTCTNGEYGDAPGGIKPGEAGHDPEAVARIRLDELDAACKTLGVDHLETLGYHDSGMPEWSYRQSPEVFANVDLEAAATRLGELYERYEPDVVVTYDEQGEYNHPDHVQASRVTMAALERTGIPGKGYVIARRYSSFARLREVLVAADVELPQWPEPDPERQRQLLAAEERITTTVDVGPFKELKRTALGQHASQIAESFLGKLPPEAFDIVFGEESFVRVHDRTGAPIPEVDLFAGLR